MFPVFHASFPLDAFAFVPDDPDDPIDPNDPVNLHTFRTMAFLYNATFGTLPAGSNTSSVTVYFDNLQLRKIDPITAIDFNNNDVADPGDWQLFMGQFLAATPTLGDLVANFGGAGTNGAVDFWDLQKFQEFYTLANPGSAAALFGGGVPEPSTIALTVLGLMGLVLARRRRLVRPAVPWAIAAIIALFAQQSAQAQLVEGWETLGKWVANPNATQGANPSVALSTTKGVTQGTHSFKVTQNVVITGDGFSWNAATTPNWVSLDVPFEILKNAVNIGAEHYNVLVDTYLDPADLPGHHRRLGDVGIELQCADHRHLRRRDRTILDHGDDSAEHVQPCRR